MEEIEADLDQKLFNHVLMNGDALSFADNFRKRGEPLESDLEQYRKFAMVVKMALDGMDNSTIAGRVHVSIGSIRNWIELTTVPRMVHFLKAYLKLGGRPAGHAWLPLEVSHGHGVPIGPFIGIPLEAKSCDCIEAVLRQLRPLQSPQTDVNLDYLFGFLLGMIIGDASKPRQGGGHRHVSLVLSKKYDTNLKLGEFTCQCAMAMGLRMHRAKDHPKPSHKPHEFYEWTSQASPLIDWIFNVALGLKDRDLTTYDPVHADWALEAPKEFRLGLVQGLAESDGSVSIASQQVEFWVDPHRGLLRGLLGTFGLRGFNNRQAFTLANTQAIKSFKVPVFSPQLETIRYKRLELMAGCGKLGKGERLSSELRSEIFRLRQSGLSIPGIIEKIAGSRRLLISFETAQRWARKEEPTAIRPPIGAAESTKKYCDETS